MQKFERITHAMRSDLTARIERLHEATKRLTDKNGQRAQEYRQSIALYSDLLVVVRRHEPGSMKIAKLSDVSGRAA